MSEPVISAELVTGLIRSQFPQWAGLPVTPVEIDGWDNRTFRVGDTMLARLSSSNAYVVQIDKEQRWLPVVAGRLFRRRGRAPGGPGAGSSAPRPARSPGRCSAYAVAAVPNDEP